MEHVAGQALGVDANEHVVVPFHVALDERDVVLVVDQRAVSDRHEPAEPGRRPGRDDALDELLVLAAVGDEVRHRDHLQVVALAIGLEVARRRHRPVVVHDLANHAGGNQAGEPRQVDRGLGLTDALEHPAGLCLQRKHVARLDQLARARLGVDRDLNRARAVGGRDARADAQRASIEIVNAVSNADSFLAAIRSSPSSSQRSGLATGGSTRPSFAMKLIASVGCMALVALFFETGLLLVREVFLKILASPVFLRAAIVLFCAGFAFFLALFLMRRMRKRIDNEIEILDGTPLSLDTLPLHLYNTVIQQLKQQKHELLVQSQAEQQRARTSENFSHAVLANLSCGVLVFGANGLVKRRIRRPKAILGFASTTGMSAQDMFRDAEVYGAKSMADVFPDETREAGDRVSPLRSIRCSVKASNGVKSKRTTRHPLERRGTLSMTISQVRRHGNLLDHVPDQRSHG